MTATKSIVATSVLSAVIVLGVAVPLSYLGYQKLEPLLSQQKSEVPSVFIELKAEVIKEIQTATDKSRDALQTQLMEQDAAQKAALAELKKTIEQVKEQQNQLVAGIEKMESENTGKVRPDIPGARADAFNQTIWFPLGAIKGGSIGAQLRAVIAKSLEYAKQGECSSNVLGFSDTLGNDASNLKLSQKRAEHIATKLKSAGLNVGTVKGWGERWLKVHTVDGVKNEENRRVVVEMTCETGMTKKAMPST